MNIKSLRRCFEKELNIKTKFNVDLKKRFINKPVCLEINKFAPINVFEKVNNYIQKYILPWFFQTLYLQGVSQFQEIPLLSKDHNVEHDWAFLWLPEQIKLINSIDQKNPVLSFHIL